VKIDGKVVLITLGVVAVGGLVFAGAAKAEGSGGGGGEGGGEGGGGGGNTGTLDFDPPAPSQGGLGGGGGKGTSNVPTGKPPPGNALTWTPVGSSCLPAFWNPDIAKSWARELGRNAPKNLQPKQLLEYGGRSAMGKCWPPPADLALWKSSFTNLYELGRAYLQGLVNGGVMTQTVAQKFLDDIRAQLVAKGGVEWQLDPHVFSNF
jgi:hypothetical protein